MIASVQPIRFASNTIHTQARAVQTESSPVALTDEEALLDIYNALRATEISDPGKFPTHIQQLREFVKKKSYQHKLGSSLVEKFPTIANRIRLLYDQYVTELEKKEAVEFSKNYTYTTSYLAHNPAYVTMELRASGVNADSRVMMIGGGALPISAVNYAKIARQTQVIDSSETAVNLAQKYIDTLPEFLSRKLTPRQEDARFTNYGPYSHIVLTAPGVEETKKAILKRIKETAKPDTMVIIRSTDGLRNLLYKQTQFDLHGLKLLGTIDIGLDCETYSIICRVFK